MLINFVDATNDDNHYTSPPRYLELGLELVLAGAGLRYGRGNCP